VGINIEAKQGLKANNGVSLGDHDILEKDHIPSLKSHGQALKQKCYTYPYSPKITDLNVIHIK